MKRNDSDQVSTYTGNVSTGNLDIWINATVENAQKMVRVLDNFGFASFGLTEADFIKSGNNT